MRSSQLMGAILEWKQKSRNGKIVFIPPINTRPLFPRWNHTFYSSDANGGSKVNSLFQATYSLLF